MAEELPPGTPEVDDPLLVADLIRLLSIKGAIGRLPLADVVIPVVSLGDVVQPTVAIRSPAFRSTDVFTQGILTNAGANLVLADTGQLVAGTYDIKFMGAMMAANAGITLAISLQHRNAANTSTLATWSHIMGDQVNSIVNFNVAYDFGYEFGTNERLRAIRLTTGSATAPISATLMARLRT